MIRPTSAVGAREGGAGGAGVAGWVCAAAHGTSCIVLLDNVAAALATLSLLDAAARLPVP